MKILFLIFIGLVAINVSLAQKVVSSNYNLILTCIFEIVFALFYF